MLVTNLGNYPIMSSNNHFQNQSFDGLVSGTPSEIEKKHLVKLSFDCTEHHANSYQNPSEKYKFVKKTEDLMWRLEKYTPKDMKENIKNHYDELKDQLEMIDSSNLSADNKKKSKLLKEFEYAEAIHIHNSRLLPNSTVMEREIQGELDITDDEAREVIQGGIRKDVKTLNYRG